MQNDRPDSICFIICRYFHYTTAADRCGRVVTSRDPCAGCLGFDSRSGNRTFWLKSVVVSLSLSMQTLRQCLKRVGNNSSLEECRLLGYKNPFRTSQETHYVSTTESSQLMLCKIWSFHGSDYEECRLLRYKTHFLPHRRHITSIRL
jgi:hypothetical protein